MNRAVILYGPPASGKDTVTAALYEFDSAFTLFRRLKVGPGRTGTYRMTTAEHLAELEDAGQILWQNSRYDATYVVDRPELDAMFAASLVPVLHLGQAEAIDAIRAAVPDVAWTAIELWCPKSIAEQRIEARETGDTTARLAAWDATDRLRDEQADYRIDTAQHTPAESARLIREAMELACRSTS